MEWSPLQKRFRKLGEITGLNKSSSYQLYVYFEPEGDVIVELGGYDIGSWNRHTHVGTFKTEQEAYAMRSKHLTSSNLCIIVQWYRVTL